MQLQCLGGQKTQHTREASCCCASQPAQPAPSSCPTPCGSSSTIPSHPKKLPCMLPAHTIRVAPTHNVYNYILLVRSAAHSRQPLSYTHAACKRTQRTHNASIITPARLGRPRVHRPMACGVPAAKPQTPTPGAVRPRPAPSRAHSSPQQLPRRLYLLPLPSPQHPQQQQQAPALFLPRAPALMTPAPAAPHCHPQGRRGPALFGAGRRTWPAALGPAVGLPPRPPWSPCRGAHGTRAHT